MQVYNVKLKGTTPYMQHRMDDASLDEWEKKRGKIIERKDVNDEDETRALFHMHTNKDGKPFVPADHIRGSLINAGAFMKAKVGNSRKSMKNIVAAMFFVNPEEVELPADEWVVDKRSAVNRNVKGRVIVVRPKWENWEVDFDLWIDDDTITLETVQELLNYAGKYVGIGSFRPQNNGSFGRFTVSKLMKQTSGRGSAKKKKKKAKK